MAKQEGAALAVFFATFAPQRLDASSLRRQADELRVEARGQTLRGFLNGQPVVETMDSTFSAAGGVGLWTKADSQTCFDDVEVSVPSA